MDELLNARDQLLRTLANQSGRQSPFSVAQMLLEARNNPDGLENALCVAFGSLGCDVRPIGGKGKPDGIAVAFLACDEAGQQRQYSIMLESKSKEEDKSKVAAGAVEISAVIRHRDQPEFDCDHALVLGRDFPTTQGEKSALAQDIAADKKATKGREITLCDADDPISHLFRYEAVVVPDNAYDWDVDIREDIRGRALDRDDASHKDENGHYDERIGPPQS